MWPARPVSRRRRAVRLQLEYLHAELDRLDLLLRIHGARAAERRRWPFAGWRAQGSQLRWLFAGGIRECADQANGCFSRRNNSVVNLNVGG